MENKKPIGANQAENDFDIIAKAKQHKNKIIGVCCIIIALAIAVIGWYFVDQTNRSKANEAAAKADVAAIFAAEPDSVVLMKYVDAANVGHKSGSRAALQAAIMLYQQKDYQQAIDCLKKASISSPIVEAGQYSLMGDCYVNLGEYDKALSAFDKAYAASDRNPEIAPMILVKKANIYREQKAYDKEYKAYQTIVDQYPAYYNRLLRSSSRIDLKQYAQRAKEAASK